MRLSHLPLLSSLLLSPAILFAGEQAATEKPVFQWDCKADREFITTYEYLRHKKELGLKPNDMRSVAMTVTKGCTGAASAFIKTTELLLKSGFDGKTAIEQARDLAVKGENFANAFQLIFRGAFAKENLDLDSGTALKLARKLTTEFKGDPLVAADDYHTIARYCVASNGLSQSRPECAKLATRLASYSEESKLPVAKAFMSAIDYLTKDHDINLSTGDALALAEALVAASPEAVESFKNAYDYAASKNGLELGRADAITFAKSVAVNTKQPAAKL